MEIPSLQTRSLTLERQATDDENEMTFSFSSETPVDRGWGREILRHDAGCADFSRCTTAPFLWNHDRNAVLGVMRKAWISGKKGHCTIKWSQEEEAQKYRRQVDEGILSNVSFAYTIDDIKEQNTMGQKMPDFHVTRWTPLEVSLVSVPADHTVGIGRAYESKMVIIREHIDDHHMEEQNLDNIRGEAVKAERERIATITALGQRHGFAELASDLIGNGATIERAREEFLNKIVTNPTPVAQPVNPLGLTDKEQRSYSILKAINASITGDWTKAGFERECSFEVAKRSGLEPKGFFVPVRDLKIEQRSPYAVGASATGGATVATDLLSQNFIDILRNSTVVSRRATMLSGLQGNIAIPKQATASNTYWVAENEDITESEATFSQIAMTPKTVAARSQYSRLFLLQSTSDAEFFIRKDFAAVLGIAIDLACIAGTGTNGQPTGILNTAGINTVALGTNGSAPTWAAMVNMLKELHVDNAPMNSVAWVTNPQVKAKLMTTPKQSSGVEGNFILGEPGSSLLGYGLEVSNQIPSNLTKGSGTNLSSIIVGNWADLLICEWGVLDILASPFGSGFNKGAVDIRVMQTLDLAVRYVQSFCAITDCITT